MINSGSQVIDTKINSNALGKDMEILTPAI